MKRLESWLVFIDAKHMASDLASDLHDAWGLLPSFPDFGNSFATFAFSFAQDDWSSRTAIAILRSRDVPRFSCSRTTGCPKRQSAPSSKISSRYPCCGLGPTVGVSEETVQRPAASNQSLPCHARQDHTRGDPSLLGPGRSIPDQRTPRGFRCLSTGALGRRSDVAATPLGRRRTQ